MDIDTSKPGQIQNRLGQDLPVGHHHDHIGLEALELLLDLFLPQRGRLEHRDLMPQSKLLYRRCLQLVAPALGLVRLGVDGAYLKAGVQQFLQRGHGKIRRAHKYYAHGIIPLLQQCRILILPG